MNEQNAELERFYKISDGHYYRVLYKNSDYSVEFSVRWVRCVDENGHRITEDFVFDDRYSSPIVNGGVANDGHVELNFNGGSISFVGREEVTGLGLILGRIYDQCASILQARDKLPPDSIGQKDIFDDPIPWKQT